MPGRTIAVGDIHGCSAALDALLGAVAPTPADTVVLLGDLVDRGPDSRAVLDRVIRLASRCRVVVVLGNHEEMLLDAVRDVGAIKKWLTCGGVETLKSYGWVSGGPRRALADIIPAAHRAFLSGCVPYFETATHVFTHAGCLPGVPMSEQPLLALRWLAFDAEAAAPHVSGKVVVVGHTPQLSAEVLDLGFAVGLDTNCVRGGWLSALDVATGRVWQADRGGVLRPTPPAGAPRPASA